jgi:hypothetical protein
MVATAQEEFSQHHTMMAKIPGHITWQTKRAARLDGPFA